MKNHLRPLGLQALGLPCQLMGSCMAFPWGVLSSVNLADAEVVEDLKLGLDLAAAGKPPLFQPQGLVSSHFPHTTSGAARAMPWSLGSATCPRTRRRSSS